MVDGVVLSWDQDDKFASGQVSDAQNNWCRVRGGVVESDCIGRVLLVVGEPVSYDFVIIRRNGKDIRNASAVVRPFKETGIDYKSWREPVLCQSKNWLLRLEGGRLVSKFEDRDFLQPGRVYEIGVEPPPPQFLTWFANSPVLIANSEREFYNRREGPKGAADAA